MKNTSTRWFQSKSQQQTAIGVAKLPVIARTGPRPDNSTSDRKQDEEGNSFFIVGESEIGGEEII